VGAHFSVLKLVIARLFAVVCLCFFVGGASSGGFVMDSEIEMREV
jgi:hypothetical protein